MSNRKLTQMSFREICRRNGINLRTRILLIKYFKDKVRKESEDQRQD